MFEPWVAHRLLVTSSTSGVICRDCLQDGATDHESPAGSLVEGVSGLRDEDLKAVCKAGLLKKTGNKAELCQRVLKSYSEEVCTSNPPTLQTTLYVACPVHVFGYSMGDCDRTYKLCPCEESSHA